MRKLKHENLLFPETRPPCPRCGSTHIISRGIEWCCADCRRRWVKEIRDEIKEKCLLKKNHS